MEIIADTFRIQPDTVTNDGIFQILDGASIMTSHKKSGLIIIIHNGGMALFLGLYIN